jgi:hypothetical protein
MKTRDNTTDNIELHVAMSIAAEVLGKLDRGEPLDNYTREQADFYPFATGYLTGSLRSLLRAVERAQAVQS